jgi:hypothetical protein
VGADVFRRRPTLRKRDWALVGLRALKRRGSPAGSAA